MLDQIETQYEKQQESIMKSLCSALESRDNHTHNHSLRVANYSKSIAHYYYRLKFYKKNESSFSDKWKGVSLKEFDRRVKTAALLHDVGKIGMTDALKKTSSLDCIKSSFIKAHVREGAKIVEDIEEMKEKEINTIVRQHHERFDGGGYIRDTAG